MRTRLQVLLAAGALLAGGGGGTPSWAQDAQADARWLAFLGCWASNEAAKEWVCVSPAAGESAADLATVIDGQVVARERIAVTGERLPSTRDGCTGWESAEWSAQGQRVYLRSEYECAGGVRRAATGLLAMLPHDEWLRVHGVTVGGQTAVRVVRYRPAPTDAPLLGGAVPAPQADPRAVIEARLAAAAPVGVGDVLEASRHVDGTVVEAWVAERADPFALDAKNLVRLADEKVPDRVIDLMVALSYPRAFERRVDRQAALPVNGFGRSYRIMDPLCYGPYPVNYLWSYDCSPFGYGLAGYPGAWYPGCYPVVIALQGAGAPRAHGRVVNGRGYTLGENTPTARPSALPRVPFSPAGSTAPSTSTTSSTSGSGEARTAKPRSPE